ncbi:MAG: hypothetical protein KF838_06630 [Phycisphaeraceae bacterium]|nr:MAG: hypothetical protein KF838_06630 [Phycisphaeraceae bacterium]
MIAERYMLLAVWLIAACWPPTPAAADPPSSSRVRSTIKSANRAYARRDFDEAAHTYSTLPPTPDRPAEICYNEALIHVALGDLERAKQSFRMADINAKSDEIRANARFNLARLAFDDAMATAESDPQAAITKLTHAARLYRSVLDVRPDDVEAAKNIERSRLAALQLRQQIEQQDQERQQRNEQLQELAQRLKDLADRQREASERSRAAEEQMQQDSSIGSETTRQAKDQQEQLSEETRELLSELMNQLAQTPRDDPGQTEMSEAIADIEEAMHNQGGAQRDLEQIRPGRAAPRQENAADELEEAAERLTQASSQDGEGSQQGRPRERQSEQGGEQGNEPDGQSDREGQDQQPQPTPPREVDRLGDQDGDPIARRLIEKEIRDRANRVRRGPPLPTEKDW